MKEKIVVNSLALNISIKCQRRCKRCYGHVDAFSSPYFMDLDTAKKSAELFLSQSPPDGSDIMFFGGEPLLNWKLIEEYVPWFNNLGTPENVRLLTITNGLALSKERIDFLAHNNVRPITMSLDGDYPTQDETRGISKEEHKHIVSMMQYGLSIHPLQVVPFCVLKRKLIPRTYEILSYITSLGATIIDVYRDLFEDWTEEDRKEFVKQANAVIKKYGVTIQPFCESIFDCTTCFAPSIMIYPNGDIYDSCYTAACVLRDRGYLSEEDCQVMYMGNVKSTDGLYMDVEKKRKMMRQHMECYLVHEDIYTALDQLQEGTNIDQPSFRVMEMIERKCAISQLCQ